MILPSRTPLLKLPLDEPQGEAAWLESEVDVEYTLVLFWLAYIAQISCVYGIHTTLTPHSPNRHCILLKPTVCHTGKPRNDNETSSNGSMRMKA